MTRSLTAALSFALCMLCALGSGCSDDDEKADTVTRTEPARVGQRGESCRARNDCQEGLACLNDVCVLNDFNITPTAKSCEVIECTSNDDCCGPPEGFCVDLEEQCRENPDSFECEDLDRFCGCDFVCNANNLCEPANTCDSDFDCGGGSCVGGKCVECGSDGDCFGNERCIQNACIAPCEGNNDCPYFHQCTGGTCQEVGCTTNRECIAFTDNPQATCVGSECVVPCQSDAECAGIGSGFGGFNFLACVDSRCTYVGCETDEECRIYLGVPQGASEAAVCR